MEIFVNQLGYLPKGPKFVVASKKAGVFIVIDDSFMIRIPGTEKRIRQTFAEVYGKENAERFFDDFLHYFITEDDFTLLKDLGINVLRLVFGYRHFEDDQAPGEYKLEGFKHLDRVLELCRKYGFHIFKCQFHKWAGKFFREIQPSPEGDLEIFEATAQGFEKTEIT